MQPIPLLADQPSIGAGRQLPPGPLEVHLWCHEHGAVMTQDRIRALLALLPVDEQARVLRLRDDSRQENYVVGRALCRRVLSRYAPVRPQEWRFERRDRGKPYIAGPTLESPLWFNLSHAAGVSVCAVTGASPEIGVDIEQRQSGQDVLVIAEQFFPEEEQDALRRLPRRHRGEGFVRLWAVKESYVKAREISLVEGLATAFDIGHPAGVIHQVPEPEPARPWHFRLYRIDRARILALAVSTQAAGPIDVRAGTCVNL